MKQRRTRTDDSVRVHSIRTTDGWNLGLSRIEPKTPSRRPPIVFLHGLGQNRYTWDLPGRSMARWFVDRGWDVWMLEMRGHGRSRKKGAPMNWNFDTFVEHDLPAALHAVRAERGKSRPFLVGHSLGGMMCYAYTPEHQHEVAGFVSIGGPVIYGKGSRMLRILAAGNTLPHRLARMKTWIELLPHFDLRILGAAAVAGFPLMQSRLARGLPLHPWHHGNVDPQLLRDRITLGFERVAPGVVAQFTRWVAERRFDAWDRSVDYFHEMERIALPVLFVGGSEDRLAPVESIRPGFERIGSKDKTFKVFAEAKGKGTPHGHLDLTMGTEAPNEIWPFVRGWLEDRLD